MNVDAKILALERKTREMQENIKFVPSLVAPFLDWPALVGLWSASSVQRSTGNVYDLSGQGRTLTYNGNPTFNVYDNLVPYCDLDGTGDYHSRADETDLDVLGSETIYASAVRGLSLAGWFWVDGTSADYGLLAKCGSAGQRSYGLQHLNGTGFRFFVSSDGTTVTATTEITSTAAGWYFVAGVYKPSTSIKCWANIVTSTNTTSIPSAIFNSNNALEIGRLGGAQNLDGRWAIAAVSANAVSDELMSSTFQRTRGLFGV